MAAEVDETDFDDRRVGRSAAELFTLLESMPPPEADVVVTHGDACLPNIMATADGFGGYVDCGRLGVADRYQDLALAARSIAFNLGEQWVVPFFQAYGVPTPDEGKRTYYELLDEFF
jgi:aminoglycoside 3'-phosphotransferase-2